MKISIKDKDGNVTLCETGSDGQTVPLKGILTPGIYTAEIAAIPDGFSIVDTAHQILLPDNADMVSEVIFHLTKPFTPI